MTLLTPALRLCCFVVFCVTFGAAQAAETTPATPAAPATPGAPAAPATGHALRSLVIGESVEAVQLISPDAHSGFVILSPGMGSFPLAELTQRLKGGQGMIIEARLLAAITDVVENFLRQHGYPTALVMVPTQNIASGVVRIIATLGVPAQSLPASEWKIRKIEVQGARWFSESLVREKLRIEQGKTIRFAELDQAIGWTNNNPFRRVSVQFNPVPNSSEADLMIAVQDALPLRLMATVDNGGNSVIGRNRYVAAVSYANLWGKDHNASYQYITTSRPDYFQAHGIDYRVPLEWRHYLQFSASYFHARPELADGFFGQDGRSITSDLRYSIPVTTGQNSTDVYVSLAFKQSNNNLTWDPRVWNIQVLSTKTDIFQMSFGGSSVRRDNRGAWAFGASITASPGDINSRNTDEAFDAARHGGTDSARLGATSRYVYGILSAQRYHNLAHGWDLSSRAMLQYSGANLLPSEQLTIGGSATVRGFPENVFAGDQGFVFNNEIMSPVLKTAIPRISKRRGPLETRGLVFLDMAHTGVHQKFGGEPERIPLAGAGVGLRMSLASNFSLTADYGWQISDFPFDGEDRSRAHVKAMLAF